MEQVLEQQAKPLTPSCFFQQHYKNSSTEGSDNSCFYLPPRLSPLFTCFTRIMSGSSLSPKCCCRVFEQDLQKLSSHGTNFDSSSQAPHPSESRTQCSCDHLYSCAARPGTCLQYIPQPDITSTPLRSSDPGLFVVPCCRPKTKGDRALEVEALNIYKPRCVETLESNSRPMCSLTFVLYSSIR